MSILNDLKKIERQDLQFFKSTQFSQQNALEYLVNADAFAALSINQKTQFILREMVVSFYLMKFYSNNELAESISRISSVNDYDPQLMPENQFRFSDDFIPKN